MSGKQTRQWSISDLLAQSPPQINIIGDASLLADNPDADQFELHYRLGPVYDVIRHPHTVLPLAIAVYGDWGAGKTSAMKWLEGLLRKWNATAASSSTGQFIIRPVWFCPWKYHTREDVWRGMIAEVVLATLSNHASSLDTIKSAVAKFGRFLGRTFLQAIKSIDIHASAGPTGLSLDLGELQSIVANLDDEAHPERAYLNQFEDTLRKWIQNVVPPNERLCVFIDDLDRCMPDVGLQVLESLKLYLSIDKLVFVAGVDELVIQSLVEQHYHNLGVPSDKARHYLSKLFQLEVRLAPTEHQVDQYLRKQLSTLSYWKPPHVASEDRDVFEQVMIPLARHNPREVKRCINNAMIASAGALMDESLARPARSSSTRLSFSNRLQVHLVDVVQQAHFPEIPLVRLSTRGDLFLSLWSQAVRGHANYIKHENQKNRPAKLDEQPIALALERLRNDKTGPLVKRDQYFGGEEQVARILSQFGESNWLALLSDPELNRLMRLPYPANTEDIDLAPPLTSAVSVQPAPIVEQRDLFWAADHPYSNTTYLRAPDGIVEPAVSDLVWAINHAPVPKFTAIRWIANPPGWLFRGGGYATSGERNIAIVVRKLLVQKLSNIRDVATVYSLDGRELEWRLVVARKKYGSPEAIKIDLPQFNYMEVYSKGETVIRGLLDSLNDEQQSSV